jgi:hypothetical protein
MIKTSLDGKQEIWSEVSSSSVKLDKKVNLLSEGREENGEGI